MSSGLEKIIQNIKERGKEERESILEEAREKVEDRKSKAQNEAEKEKKRILEKGKREADRISRRKKANARRKAREKKLEAREEIINEVFDKTKEELVELKEDEEKYREILEELIIRGGVTVGGGDIEVLLPEEDGDMLSEGEINDIAEEISSKTGESTSLKILTDLQGVSGGTVVQKSDGRVSCDNTFKARLRRMKNSLRPKIANILFEE